MNINNLPDGSPHIRPSVYRLHTCHQRNLICFQNLSRHKDTTFFDTDKKICIFFIFFFKMKRFGAPVFGLLTDEDFGYIRENMANTIIQNHPSQTHINRYMI